MTIAFGLYTRTITEETDDGPVRRDVTCQAVRFNAMDKAALAEWCDGTPSGDDEDVFIDLPGGRGRVIPGNWVVRSPEDPEVPYDVVNSDQFLTLYRAAT